MKVDEDVAKLLATTFHELREGVSSQGTRIDKPSAVMSTAEAVSVYYQSMMNSYYYGESQINVDGLVQNIIGAVAKETRDDLEKLKNYFNVIVKSKAIEGGELWKKYYEARKWIK